MSIEALEWARRQWVGDAHAKSLLRAVADYAGEEGVCFPSLRRLARDCEFSEDTVRRKLKALEEGAWLVRIKSWMDDQGRRNTEGRGRETSHEIRLLLSRASEPPVENNEDESNGEGLHPARVAACEASTGARGGVAVVPPLYELPSNEERTPNPLSGGVCEAPTGEAIEAQESFSPFAEVYPSPITDMGKALAVWSALTETERSDAILGAKGYRSYIDDERKAKRNRAVKDAHRWLRDKLWLGYLAAGKQSESAAERFDARENSEQWNAWTVFYRCCGYATGIPNFYITGIPPSRIANVPREWPPVGRGIDPHIEWITVIEGTGPFAAWLRKLREVPKVNIALRSEIIAGARVQVIRVPCEWPPARESTGPPGTLATESELNEFCQT